jgi:hypothetical protein
MRTLSRMTVVLAFAVALLLALPAHAAPPQRSHAAPATSSQAISAWLGSLWADFTRLLAPAASPPASHGSQTRSIGQPGQPRSLGTSNGGSCIDPDGCALY